MMSNKTWSYWKLGRCPNWWSDGTKEKFDGIGNGKKSAKYKTTLYDAILKASKENKDKWMTINELRNESIKFAKVLDHVRNDHDGSKKKDGHETKQFPNRLYLVMLKLVHDKKLEVGNGSKCLMFRYIG